MIKFSAKVARLLALGVLIAFVGAAGAQQAYPVKPIRFIVPFPPGGSTDPLARLVGQKLTEAWGQQVIVENRPGGATVIGTEAAAKAAPDGYTILLAASTHVINSLLMRDLPYDSFKDFAPVANLIKSEFVLVLHPAVPVNNLQQFIALAKSKPGELNYGTAGNGNPNHLAGELFNMMAGVKMQAVPYKGGGPAITDLLGGQVEVLFSVLYSVVPHIKAGRLKAIAVARETRLPSLPQVPTFIEAGLPGFDPKSWQGIIAPAGTPKAIIDKMATEISRILAQRDVSEKLRSQGTEPFFHGPEQFAKLMQADSVRIAAIIKTANIKLD